MSQAGAYVEWAPTLTQMTYLFLVWKQACVPFWPYLWWPCWAWVTPHRREGLEKCGCISESGIWVHSQDMEVDLKHWLCWHGQYRDGTCHLDRIMWGFASEFGPHLCIMWHLQDPPKRVSFFLCLLLLLVWNCLDLGLAWIHHGGS